MRRTWVGMAAVAIVFSCFIGALAAADAQFRLPKLPKKSDIPRFDRLPSLNDLLGRAPLTSSLDDAVTEVAFLDRFDPKSAPAMLELPFGLDDGVTLVPGLWGGMIQSYCLKAGTLAPTRGHGYLYAPLKGPKADVVTAILNRSAQHPDLPQHDIQVLLWGIIARTKVSQMGEGPRRAAETLLTRDQIASIDGSALDVIPDQWLNRILGRVSDVTRHALEAENRMRQAFASPDAVAYEQLERIAIREGVDIPDESGRVVPAGRWSWHPDGFYIRFMPTSYTHTELEIYVPERFTAERDDAGRLTSIADAAGSVLRIDYDSTRQPIAAERLSAQPVRHATFSTHDGKTRSLDDVAWVLTGIPDGSAPVVPGWADVKAAARTARDAWREATRLAGESAAPDRSRLVADVSHLAAAIDDPAVSDFLSRAWASAAGDLIGGVPSGTAANADPLRRARHISASTGLFLPPPIEMAASSGIGWGGGAGGGFGPGGGGGMPGGGRQRIGPSMRKFGDDNPIDKARRAIDGIGMAQNALDAGDPAGFLGMGIPNDLFGRILDFNFDKWGQAAGALAGDPPRDDFREVTKPIVPSDLPHLSADVTVTAERARVLNDLLLELATANAWMEAGIVALDRHGGAVKAGDRGWASKQARALIYLKRGAGQHMLKAAGDLDQLASKSESLEPIRKNGRVIFPARAWKEAADGMRLLGEHFAALPAGAQPW
ncbi:MAG TPA: hypothetical protein VFK20_13465 [Vicinamibacterales bacterium]|nr:hypothetical protein [Vicinamibacterales bacterium]